MKSTITILLLTVSSALSQTPTEMPNRLGLIQAVIPASSSTKQPTTKTVELSKPTDLYTPKKPLERTDIDAAMDKWRLSKLAGETVHIKKEVKPDKAAVEEDIATQKLRAQYLQR